MISTNQFRFNTLAAAISALTFVPAAQAQAQSANSADAPRTSGQLAPITVRGEAESAYKADQSASQKFTAPLLDTPKSVTVIPQEIIENTASTTLTEALRLTPGISFGAGEGGNPLGDRPFIRGYDAQSSTYIDGMRDIGAVTREVFNLEQIEVIKGPDGAYGGRGGAGGSINLITKTPKAEKFTNATLGLGTDNYKRATVDGNWLLGDSMAFRLNAMAHDADVAGRNGVDVSRWGIAPSFTWGLNTPTRVTLSYSHIQTDDTPDSGIPFMYGNRVPAGVTAIRPVTVNMDNFYGLKSDFYKTRSDVATARVEHDISSNLTVRNTLRYTSVDQRYVWTNPDDSQGNVNDGRVWRNAKSRTGGVHTIANQTELFGKANLGGYEHSFNTGIEISREKSDTGSYTVARTLPSPNNTGAATCAAGVGAPSGYNCTDLYNPNPNDPWNGSTVEGQRNNHFKATTFSVYGFDTIKLSEKWLTNLGARVDNYKTGLVSPTADVGRSDTLFNYQLGLIYKPAKNGSVYVSYGTSSTPANSTLGQGSESQGIVPGRNGVGVNAKDMAPEKNRSLEVGTKWNVLDNRLALSGAIFRIDTTNARVTQPDGTYAMAGNRRINGFEIGASGNITKAWQVFGGYTFLDSEVRDLGRDTAAASGQAFPNTPKHTATLWTTYAINSDFSIGGGVFISSKQYGSNAAVRRYIPGYTRFDAMAAYRINRNVSLQLNLMNLTDKRYFTTTYSTHYASVGAGRAAILNLNLKY
ncbi:TonB-dependent siderophore receptor [Pigmentiphaga sp. GD03639]|uniref:TonB-dependent siderophore receptor n=1 Tax=Pigmentiphaga daeguensis TaxID=414049 RepID=A0ABP3L7K9_9BURK|nr:MULTISPECIES: TonB-dependent siderophore receptor [unclassified Pigmentiphaga]MDH2237623.1 TonB-dependent siderophore receptor [Pigmentiphaga sp. GD03639]